MCAMAERVREFEENDKGGRTDISRFAWDTGPNRRCSARGKPVHGLHPGIGVAHERSRKK